MRTNELIRRLESEAMDVVKSARDATQHISLSTKIQRLFSTVNKLTGIETQPERHVSGYDPTCDICRGG